MTALRLSFVILALMTGAFLDFAGRLKPAFPTAVPIADGVVALTGGTDRLDAAIRLLNQECCKRMYDRHSSAQSKACRRADHSLLSNTDINKSFA